ncbi:MAG: hypothetical protein LBU51_09615 [Bacteroidales bacterium]|nr:hypothetical protein [Bacteroidales bacterium]
MKKLLITLFLSIGNPIFSQENNAIINDPIKIKGYNLLMIGEYHSIKEFHQSQELIIKNIIYQNQNIHNFQLLTEEPPSLNYYLEKLFEENDSVNFKNYWINRANNRTDTLLPIYFERYNFFMKLFYFSKSLSKQHLSIKAIDGEYHLRGFVFSLTDILKKYQIKDSAFIEQIEYLNTLCSKKTITI